MANENNVGSWGPNEFIKTVEDIVDRKLKQYFTAEIMAYFSLEGISNKKINQRDGLLDIESISKLLKVTRQTLFNWERRSKFKHLLGPFIHKFGKRKYYDPRGIMLVLYNNQKNFGGDRFFKNRSALKPTDTKMASYSYEQLKAKIQMKQTLTNEELLFYLDNCKVSSDINLLLFV
jgi:hypothetical protein